MLALLAIAALALVTRSANLGQVFPADGSGPRILFVDTFYHLRRIELIVSGGHWIPPFDFYSTYPTGGDFFWPPLFDQGLAAAAWAVRPLVDSAREAIRWVGALLPVVLGALVVFPVFALGRLFFGRAVGLVSAAAIAVFPWHAEYTCLGRPDHHGAETLLLTLTFLLFVRVTIEAEKRRVRFRDLVGPRARLLPWGRIALCGVAAAATLSVQMGAVLLLGVIPAVVAVRFFLAAWRGRDVEPLLVAASLTLGIATALLGPLHTLWGGNRRFEFVYNQPSLFQPTLLLLFALVPYFLHRIARPMRLAGARGPIVALVGAAASAMVFLVLPLVLIRGFRGAVVSAAGWVGGEEVYLPTVLETQPLFRSAGGLSLEPIVAYSGFLLPAAVVGLALLPSWMRSSRRIRRDAQLFLLVWSLAFFVLSINQVRFLMYGAVNASLLAGAAVGFPFVARAPASRRARGAFGIPAALAAALSALLLAHAGFVAHRRIALRDRGLEPPLERCFEWMADGTPATSFYLDPDRRPEYGVMTTPEWGHHIVWFARRPVTSNPFFDLDGLRRTAAFFLARDENEALRALDAAGCRYVVFTHRAFDTVRYAGLLDGDLGAHWTSLTGEAERIERLARTPSTGLYLLDGAFSPQFSLGGRILEMDGRYDRFRLVWESAESLDEDSVWIPFRGFGGIKIPFVKVYERVEGARVVGRGAPGAAVQLTLPIRTNADRTFVFSRTVVCGLDGRFEFRVPYAGSPNLRWAGTGESPSAIGERVVIPEEAVVSGGIVEVPR